MYVPNLIPEKHRVIASYFIKQANKPATTSNKVLQILSTILSVLLFMMAVPYLFLHFWLGCLFGVLGFLFLPYGHRWIEKNLRFKLTGKVKTGLVVPLFIALGVLGNHYGEIDQRIALEQQLEADRNERIKIEAHKKEQARKDSLNLYLSKAENLTEQHRYAQAVAVYDSALTYSTGQQTDILVSKASCLVGAGKYEDATAEITALINLGVERSDLYFQRAVCLNKQRKIEDAVSDLKVAMQLGSLDAEKFHDQINPVRRRITGYVTRCCDGSTSYARGRGACSHHGGVCDWNDPVYEEYRKYE